MYLTVLFKCSQDQNLYLFVKTAGLDVLALNTSECNFNFVFNGNLSAFSNSAVILGVSS